MDSLRRGVDSPLSIASFTIQVPRRRRRSAGTVVSTEPRAAKHKFRYINWDSKYHQTY